VHEIRRATNRFHILRLVAPVSADDVSQLAQGVRALDRAVGEPLVLLTDLRAAGDLPPGAGPELEFMMRLNKRGVRAHVLVVEAGSDAETELRAITDDRDARDVVTSLNDARRELANHFGPAEDFAFEDYWVETR
jgi:hypothetical protein